MITYLFFTEDRKSTILKCLRICVVSFLHQSANSESYDIPLSDVKKPEDISNRLPPIEIPEAPDGFSWQGYAGSVNISTNILFPYEGQVLFSSCHCVIGLNNSLI
jgi:hypothetical protein